MIEPLTMFGALLVGHALADYPLGEKATAGPWAQPERYHCKDVQAAGGAYVADCNSTAAFGWEQKCANAAFIALSRNHAPAIATKLIEACELLELIYADIKAIHYSHDLEPAPTHHELNNLERARAFLLSISQEQDNAID